MSLIDEYKHCRKLHRPAYCFQECIRTKPKPISKSVRKILYEATGCQRSTIYIRDAKLDPITFQQAQEFLEYDKINLKKYNHDLWDCDDYADLLYTSARVYFLKKGINPMWGNLWDPEHAVNCFVTDKQRVHIVEPQTDGIHNTTYLKGRPRFIKM